MDIENLVIDAVVQAFVNGNTEAIKGILRQTSRANYDAPKRFRFPTVEDCIFRTPAVCLLPKMDDAGLRNFDPFHWIDSYAVLGNILFHVAARLPDYELARVLLEKGADVNSTNDRGLTALHTAAMNSDYELIRLLVENGADVNRADIDGRRTALHFACEPRSHWINNSDSEIIRLLLEKGADVTKADRSAQTALHMACQTRSSVIVKLLAENSPASVLNLGDSHGDTPFDYACGTHSPEIVLLLLSRGSSVVAKDSRRRGPLFHAVCYSNANYVMPIASILIEAGAKIHPQSLITAVERAGSELRAMKNFPRLATHYPIFIDLCTMLIDRGCDINAVDRKGQTALHVAVRTKQEMLVRKLLISRNDIDIDKRDSEGYTPILCACARGSRRLVDLLKISGASLRIQDWETAFGTWRTDTMLKEKYKNLYKYVIDSSKKCLTLENLCYISIRKTIRNVEKDAIKLGLSPLLVKRLQLKE